ncbi:MAG: hypothetical protein HY825_03060 [Acidobacteria bacterium]|nr:hypothetical protein [Acidobacteriota bacterium]
MLVRKLPVITAVTAAAAAWTASRSALFLPLFWVALLLGVLALPPDRRRLFGTRWLVAGCALLLVSWVVALDHELAMRHLLLALGAVMLFGLTRVAAPGDRVVDSVALAIAATSLVALGQWASGLGGALEMVDTLAPALREAAATRLAGGRVFGTSALPGHFAALLLLAVPLLASRVAGTRGRWRVTRALVLLPLAVAFALTRSLAGFLVGGALVPLAAAGRGVRRWHVVAAGAIAVAAVGVAATRADLGRLEPLALRWVNWRTTAGVAAAHPWTGVGLGGVGQAGLVLPGAAENITPYTHNTWLQLVAELGLAGVGVVVAGAWAIAGLIRRSLADHRPLALAVAVLPLHNLVDFSAYAPEVVLPWAFLAGALASRSAPAPARPVPAAALVPVLALGCLLSTAGWRAETGLARATAGPPAETAERALAAARWTPWALTPVLVAADALRSGSGSADALRATDAALADRWWVRPRSAAWAESRAMLLLAQGRPGEAEVWAREARRRAPHRGELAALEDACRLAH